MTEAATEAQRGTWEPPFSRAYSRYVLGILFVVYVFNFIDRQILSILIEPIRLELGLSDTEIGFLTGMAFALFYATLGMPIARIADRTSRRGVITVCLSLWSGMTALCGLAGSYWQLLAARIGVAVGEAGGSPPAHSLISDYFPPHQRATALGFYSLGVSVGVMFGLVLGGWINEFFGWRTAFFVVGVPGFALAVLFRLSVREPPRLTPASEAAEAHDIRQVFAHLWSQRSFAHLAFASSLHAFVGYGVGQWNPPFFMRMHGMGTGEIGTYLALIAGISGSAGVFLGGWFADRLARRDRRWYMWLLMIAMAVSTPFYLIVYLTDSAAVAFGVLLIPTFLGFAYHGPAFAMTQALVPSRMRAVAAAVLLFIINIIGLGLGPQLVGVLSDLFRPLAGVESLRYALLLVSLAKLWAAFHYWRASKTLVPELERVERMEAGGGR